MLTVESEGQESACCILNTVLKSTSIFCEHSILSKLIFKQLEQLSRDFRSDRRFEIFTISPFCKYSQLWNSKITGAYFG